MEPRPLALEAQHLNNWTAREVMIIIIIIIIDIYLFGGTKS